MICLNSYRKDFLQNDGKAEHSKNEKVRAKEVMRSFYKNIDLIDTHMPGPAPKKTSNLAQVFFRALVVFAGVMFYIMSDNSGTQRVYGVSTNELNYQTDQREKYYNKNFSKLEKITLISS